MTLSGWIPLLLAIPVLLLGETLTRRVGWLGRFHIPSPVVGGLLVSFVLLACALTGVGRADFASKVDTPWWTWLVTVEPRWRESPAVSATLPLMVAFFTCIGLNATWDVVRKGSGQVFAFLGLGIGLAVLQNAVGVGMAHLLDVDPLLGLVCGSVTMTGGHGTALGFAPVLEREGLQGAPVLGAAAATLGLVAGGLIGGPVGARLIRRFGLRNQADRAVHLEMGSATESGIVNDLRALWSARRVALAHLAVVLVCVKAGAWASHFMELTGLKIPPHVGGMILGVLVRNALEFGGRRWIRSETVDLLASIFFAFFLTAVMMSLNLRELAHAALPMLAILGVQVALMAAFATWITFRLMGRDYDAAVMAAGHCGFGLGATPNALANMKALADRMGPAPRAFLIVPLVGAVLIDFGNILNITLFLNLLR